MTSLLDVAGTEVAGFGEHALVFVSAANGEAPDMDAVTVPVAGDGGDDALVAASDGLGEETCASLGAVDEDVHQVAAVGTNGHIAAGDGSLHSERSVELDTAELGLGQVALGDFELGEVDGGAAGGVGVDERPVFDDEDVAFGHLFALGDLLEANQSGLAESTSQRGDGSETSLHKLLSLGEVVRASVFFARHRTHDGFALPERTTDGADFADESVEDAFLNFTHSCKSFELVIE